MTSTRFSTEFGIRGSLYQMFTAHLLSLLTTLLAIDPLSAAESGREVGRIKGKTLQEVSGMAASRQNPGVLWLHNDGQAKRLYAVKTSGKMAAQLKLPFEVEDVEDIAIGPGPDADKDYLYVGDIGDNDRKRREIRVVRFLEPSLSDGVSTAEGAQLFQLTYPDGAHDAEALMVDQRAGDLLIATKEEGRSRIYGVSIQQLELEKSAKLHLIISTDVSFVSAGDVSRDGSMIVLRRENQGWLWQRSREESLAAVLAEEPKTIPVRGKKQGENGEAIAFEPENAGYYTVSEGKDERIYLFDLAE